jgi:hypothetical protein
MQFSFYPKIVWNIQSDMHVSIQGRVLYKTPHIRLGYPLDGDTYGIYVFFPHLDDERARKTTYLRTEEHKIWIDEIFLPSIMNTALLTLPSISPGGGKRPLTKLVLGRRRLPGGQRPTI